MCCLFSVLAILGPRAAIVVHWLLYPAAWALAFDGPIIPLLGMLFTPWTVLTYVLVFPGGVDTVDAIFVILAFGLDIFSIAGGAFSNRDRFQGTSAA
jgi:hypothetical protein